jgi:hypothetical protein
MVWLMPAAADPAALVHFGCGMLSYVACTVCFALLLLLICVSMQQQGLAWLVQHVADLPVRTNFVNIYAEHCSSCIVAHQRPPAGLPSSLKSLLQQLPGPGALGAEGPTSGAAGIKSDMLEADRLKKLLAAAAAGECKLG